MADSGGSQITLRIPGDWAHPGKLLQRLPAGCRMSSETLRLADGAEFEFLPMRPDDQFRQVFRSSCRRPATREELAVVDRYTVNIGLTGPGGSREAARALMRAGAAIIQAGGAGVFIDNSALAHGGRHWTELTEDGSAEALSFAFTSIVQGREDVSTIGLQALGLPDLRIRRAEIDEHGLDALIDILCYLCETDRPVDVGHLLVGGDGPSFHVVARQQDEFDAGSPMHNPWGQLRIASSQRLAEEN